jgi:hypothetical protein
MAYSRVIVRLSLIVSVIIIAVYSTAFAEPSVVSVDAAKVIAIVPNGLYGVGYNGWGDITDPEAVRELNDVGVRFCRIDLDLREMCGERFGDFRWEYTTPRDGGLGFASRVKRIIANGWTPIVALSTSFSLPKWFQGDPTDAKGNPWTKLNLDGKAAAEGASDQYAELERVTAAIAAGLAERGLKGLYWETIYEIGHTMPMADIHHSAAKGIHEADPTAKLMGPATWPGWTVEERFVKPYLAKYGPDLLDFVTVHWYADNEHGLWAMPGWKERKGPTTMADGAFLQCLMETTPKFGDWCLSLRKALDDPQLNPRGKRIGVVYTEFDALAESPFQRNPENPDWPKYWADADCYLNTNAFGGVWCASVLCHLAACGALDIACKFNTRQFYGLIDNKADKGYYRQPVWFAWKLLRDVAGLRPGARMLAVSVAGPLDNAKAHVDGKDTPWVEAYAVKGERGPRLILINRSLEAQTVSVRLAGKMQRYVFDQDHVARFIGRKPGTKDEGRFEGYPGDEPNLRCLKAVGEVAGSQIQLPAVSMTVLTAEG